MRPHPYRDPPAQPMPTPLHEQVAMGIRDFFVAMIVAAAFRAAMPKVSDARSPILVGPPTLPNCSYWVSAQEYRMRIVQEYDPLRMEQRFAAFNEHGQQLAECRLDRLTMAATGEMHAAYFNMLDDAKAILQRKAMLEREASRVSYNLGIYLGDFT